MSNQGEPEPLESEKVACETSAPTLRDAVLRRLPVRLSAAAEFRVPPAPALLDHWVQLFNNIWLGIGRGFNAEDLELFRGTLKQNLEQAWAASPYSRVLVSFATDALPQTTVSWRVDIETMTMADEYDHWVATRSPPLFGKYPDAKVFEVARTLGPPGEVPILDVGAGTGRNTLPLARAGFPADAVELVPALAAILRDEAAKDGLRVQVFERSIFDPELDLPPGYYRILLLAEVVPHFRSSSELRALFQVAARLLPSGGLLVFSAFLNRDGYEPDDVVRQMSQVSWCKLFTRRELQEALAGTPFQSVSDESVPAFEKVNLPAEEWPPTGWFETWSAGQDLFDLPIDKPPMDLRWLVFRKDEPGNGNG
jgi:SAM-dependent methyltransferase